MAADTALDTVFKAAYISPRRCSDFSDYKKARALINAASDAATDAARHAGIFERLIQDNRLS